MVIVDSRVVVSLDSPFFTAYPRVLTLAALQIAGRCDPLSFSRLPCVQYGAGSTPDNSRCSQQPQLG